MKCLLKNATMQGLVLSPYLIIINDPNKKSGVNVITISYVGVICENPPIISLAIRPNRYSYSLLEKEKDFTVNMPRLNDLKLVDYCGTISGKKYDKVEKLNLKLKKATTINGSFLENSPFVFECKVKNIMANGIGSTHNTFIARVITYHHHQNFKIENSRLIATTNYNYREVDTTLGTAHHMWHKNDKGG